MLDRHLAIFLGICHLVYVCCQPPPGEVVVVGGCEVPGNNPNAFCQRLRIRCPQSDFLGIDVLVEPPPQNVPEIGTLVLGSGGAGTGFYNGQLVRKFNAAGFRTVNRRWISQWGNGVGGVIAASCRYATLLWWVRDQAWHNGPLCATGTSAGSAEISYVLAHWKAGDVLASAILTAGPPFGRLDLGCRAEPIYQGVPWMTACRQITPAEICSNQRLGCYIGPRNLIDGAYPGGDTPCANASPVEAQRLLQDSIMAPTANLSYPNTAIHFLFGRDDCSDAVPLGLTYAYSLPQAQIDIVAGTHGLPASPEAQDAMVKIFQDTCVL